MFLFSNQHYLSYLNCLRVKEFSGAVHSLLRTYDGQLTPREPGRVEDQGRGFRYAAMNLAALHAHFGHKWEKATLILIDFERISKPDKN